MLSERVTNLNSAAAVVDRSSQVSKRRTRSIDHTLQGILVHTETREETRLP